jgi:GNAT superfamily N-acetyltransferase
MDAFELPGKAPQSLIPIRSIGPRHRGRIAKHLLALDAGDRYLRFGYPATDEHIARYVAGIDFERGDVFGIFNRKLELIAVAHLAFAQDPSLPACAEFGVSVLKKARGRGYGSRLFERAAIHARNQGVDMLFIHALSENTAMLNIARHAGAVLEHAGSETDAHLRLPPATFDSRMSELAQEQFALTDYRLKAQARSFSRLLAGLQEVRQGVREGRHKSSS